MSTPQDGNNINREAEFDQYCDTYSERINQALSFSGQSHDFFTKVKADYLSEILSAKQLFNDEIKALDIGCGHGLIHPYLLARHGKKLSLCGVDVASSVIDVARNNNPNVVYQAYDGEYLPYDENTFDIVFAICVMHHVPPQQWVNFLKEMRRVIRSNGLVVVFEHNPANPITRKIVKSCPLDENAVLISSRRMKKLMHQAGIDFCKTNFILFTPFDRPIFQKLDRKLQWLPLGTQYYAYGTKK